MDIETFTPLILRPNFKKKNCIGFREFYGRTQINKIKETVENVVGHKFKWTDTRATAENHVDKISKKMGVHISREDIAATFGRHSKDVMESSYLIPEKTTKPLEFLNLVREIHDQTGFTENDNTSNFLEKKRILYALKNKQISKRKSMELLSQNQPICYIQERAPTTATNRQELPSPNLEEHESTEDSVMKENIPHEMQLSQALPVHPNKKICLSQNIQIYYNNTALNSDLANQLIEQNRNLQQMMFQQNQMIIEQQQRFNQMFFQKFSSTK